MTTRTLAVLFAILVFGLLAGLAFLLVFWPRSDDLPPGGEPPVPKQKKAAAGARYVGRQACVDCHPEEYDLWSGSDHDLAMQVATESTVLGDFNNVTFTHFGVTSTFSRKGKKFIVRTEGPDGKLHDYEVAYAFGVIPLQQYLVGFPGGRYQTLPLCWDTRPKEDGGQRWFHIYQDEKIPPDDVLHWTGPNQNWNFMCAECHSTDLQKNFDVNRDRYATAWAEIDVSCEACHGPGSEHVAWAKAVENGEEQADSGRMGLTVRLKDPDQDIWIYNKKTGNAKRLTPRRSNVLVDTCARCHARRIVVNDDYVHGRPFMDAHRPSLLTDPLYHADGQILDEVYVYGSFLQSKMFHHSVVCSDCHDSHSLKLREPRNVVCHRCHLAAKFDTPLHHFHKPESKGAACAECHMPESTYMVVDPRRDHSIRVPRPDLTVKLGTPNACNRCHPDKSAAWAVEAMDKWYGTRWRAKVHFGEALHAGRTSRPGAQTDLVGLVFDVEQPNIARATALTLLRRYPGADAVNAARIALRDEGPLVRHAALGILEDLPPADRLRYAYPLLRDKIRAVRVRAARVLSAVPPVMMTAPQRVEFDRAAAEYIQSELANADRPSAHLNIGVVHTNRGRLAEAEAAYRTALRLDPSFTQAHVNLADLYRQQGRDDEGERVLREALQIDATVGEAHHALGLLQIRRKAMAEALKSLRKAAELRPGRARFSYVYGVALHTAGQAESAVRILEKAHERHPADRELLVALVTINRDRGALDAAIKFAKRLVAAAPRDPNARRLLEQVQAMGGR